MKSGAELIAEERADQLEKHGRSVESDAEINDYYELAMVAKCLIMPPNQDVLISEELRVLNVLAESWDQEILGKMLGKTYKERLIIAGALLAAEIDRLQYTEAKEQVLDGRVPVVDLETKSTLAIGQQPAEGTNFVPVYVDERFKPVDLSFAEPGSVEFVEKDRKPRGVIKGSDWIAQFSGPFTWLPSTALKGNQALWNPEKKILYVSEEVGKARSASKGITEALDLIDSLDILILED